MSSAARPTGRSELNSTESSSINSTQLNSKPPVNPCLSPIFQVSVLFRHWVTVPLALQPGPVDLAAAVAAVRARVPPARASLTCNQGAPGRHCAGQPVPTRLIAVQGQHLWP